MKIVELKAENIKRLVAVEIKPDGSLVQITGRNGAGKTSLLDSIFWALAGVRSHQPEPIRKGQDEALIELDLGKLLVKRTFKRVQQKLDDAEDGPTEERINTSLTVSTVEGAKFPSPQAMLDKLLDSISFDPLAFARMDAKAQHAALKTLCGLDFTELEAQSAAAYDKRRDHNRTAKERRAAAAQITVPEDAPAEPVDVAALMAKLDEAEDANRQLAEGARNRAAAHERTKALLSEAKTRLAQAASEVDAAEKALADAKRRQALVAEEVEEHTKAVAALPELTDPEFLPTGDLKAEIAGAETKNAAHRARQEKAALEAKAEEAEAAAQACTDEIDDCKETMETMIMDAEMPVDGLGLHDGMVTFNGYPFEQASDAEKLRISCAIAMRGNHELRVIRVRDGSLLDQNGLEVLAKMAAAAGYQVWLERVDTSGEVGFVIEDGRLKGDTGEPDLFDQGE